MVSKENTITNTDLFLHYEHAYNQIWLILWSIMAQTFFSYFTAGI